MRNIVTGCDIQTLPFKTRGDNMNVRVNQTKIRLAADEFNLSFS